ncbi:MAG: peptidyl-prolyl cis-trans isomerase [Armatimonadetes bacterium]|nr:peptidyl-prolyl cis-trans isomerase [Armatimonadota bacterium]
MKRQFLAFSLLAALSSAAFAQDKPMLVVNGDAINRSTYSKRLEVLPGVGKLVNGRFVEATPGFLTLQQLVNERLMIQLAKDKGVAPTAKEIDDEIAVREKENPGFVAAYTRTGFTTDDLKYDILVQLSEFKLTTMGITITDFQVSKFYEDNKIRYTLPKRYKVRLIAVSSDAEKKAVDDALAGGKAFSEVATQHSKDVSRFDGGLMGELPEGSLGDNIKPIVTNMQKGQTTPWLSSADNQTHIRLFLEDVLAEKVVPLDESLKRQIWRTMMVDRGRIKNDVPKMMENKRKASQFEFQGTIFDRQLKEIYDGK